MRNTRKFCTVAAVAALALNCGTVSASADTAINASDEQVESVRSELAGMGVSEEDQNILIQKLGKGVTWDSLKPESRPVSEKSELTDEGMRTIMVYADGSVKSETVPFFITPSPPDSTVGPKPHELARGSGSTQPMRTVTTSISAVGCDSVKTTHYSFNARGCRVKYNSGVYGWGYRFDYVSYSGVTGKFTHVDQPFSHWTTIPNSRWTNLHVSGVGSTRIRLSGDLEWSMGQFFVCATATSLGSNSARFSDSC